MRISRLILIAAMLAGFGSAGAQEFPTRPIRAISATSAGGTSDVFMRVLGEELQKRWGQPIIMENRPGGNLIIGGKACADGSKDGYTICILPGEVLTFNRYLNKSLPYDPAKDFEPISNLFFSISGLVVNSSLKVKSVEELAALAKAKPKTLAYMAPSISLTLFMDKFNKDRGTDIIRVPFRGGGETANAILSGAVPVAFLGLSNFVAHLENGSMTALAVDSAQRSTLLPATPTLIELGYPDNPIRPFFGLWAPAGTPKPITEKIRAEVAKIVSDPAFREKNMIRRGLEPAPSASLEEFAQFVAKYDEAAGRAVKEAGMLPP
jgi:tripartite-type tricarboxylate transporter receptor subunit TctC